MQHRVMETPAIEYLQRKGIHFEIRKYEHNHRGARFAAKAMGFPLAGTIKTLVVDLDRKGYALVLMPGDKEADLKAVAESVSVKRAAMADFATAERLTGYLVGGISPFQTAKELPVIMDENLMHFEKVAVNGGRRGLMLIMSPEDILRATSADVFNVAKEDVS